LKKVAQNFDYQIEAGDGGVKSGIFKAREEIEKKNKKDKSV
jgi:hypothetical protein